VPARGADEEGAVIDPQISPILLSFVIGVSCHSSSVCTTVAMPSLVHTALKFAH
jgi:hypothetical protein